MKLKFLLGTDVYKLTLGVAAIAGLAVAPFFASERAARRALAPANVGGFAPPTQKSGGGACLSANLTTNTIPMATGESTLGDSSLVQDANDNLQTNKRLQVIVDLDDTGEDPALKVTTNGTNIGAPVGHALDGGVQSFHVGSYDTTGGQRQSFAGLFSNDSTVATGSGGLIATGIEARATGGTENYSFKGSAGTLRNDDDAVIGTALTVGPGTAAPPGHTILYTTFAIGDNTKQVTLGNNVDPFVIPGTSGTNPTLNLGYGASAAAQIATKNTAASSLGGLEVHLDTSVSSGARGGMQIYRGSGGVNEVAGFNVAGGESHFAVGSAPDDVVIHSYDPGNAGRSIVFGTGATPDVRAKITNVGDLQMPVTGRDGHLVDKGTAPSLTSCGMSPRVDTGAWSFTVTTGTGATGCTITFSRTFTTTPTCTVTSRNGTNAAYMVSATMVTLGAGTAASATYDIRCTGH